MIPAEHGVKFQRNVRPLRAGVDRKGFGRWGEVGFELGIEGHTGCGYRG